MYNRVTVIEQRFRQDLPERDNAYYFGFLPVPWSISCESFSITPLPDYADMSQCLGSHVHSDGFLYPPAQRDLADPLTSDARLEIPRSERPGFMHFLPASHELQFANNPMRDPHRRSGAFVIHLLGDFPSPHLIGWISDRHNLRVGLGATLISLAVSGAILFAGARFAPPLPDLETK